ncbi:unnamed protein product, partial [Musa acuminata subsp. burmannicoides]
AQQAARCLAASATRPRAQQYAAARLSCSAKALPAASATRPRAQPARNLAASATWPHAQLTRLRCLGHSASCAASSAPRCLATRPHAQPARNHTCAHRLCRAPWLHVPETDQRRQPACVVSLDSIPPETRLRGQPARTELLGHIHHL